MGLRSVVLTIVLAGVLVVGLLGAGWWFMGRHMWGIGVAQAQGPVGPNGQGWNFWGPGGMMGGFWGNADSGTTYNGPCFRSAGVQQPTDAPLTIQQAEQAVERYISGLGYSGLEVDEVMQFQQNFYAIVAEKDTGVGAMELLVDPQTGSVGPEYGPNMMWNAKYGMHTGAMGWMMGGVASGEMTVTPDEARNIAQRWLDSYRPGNQVESHADAFYGYYTIHTLRDGTITGMLSVNGSTGQVWYHNWHGDFVQMIGGDES